MISRKILIVEDDFALCEILKLSLQAEKFEVIIANNGKEGYEKLISHKPSIVVTDLLMPNYDGSYIIEKTNLMEDKPIIIVMSVTTDIQTVIPLIKSGAYDYILKPFKTEEFILKIHNTWEYAKMKSIQALLDKERDLRIEEQLNWNIWKLDHIKKNQDDTDYNLFDSLQTSFSQGSGFGALLSMLVYLKDLIQQDGDYYKIEKETVDFIIQNAEVSQKVIRSFEQIKNIINSKIEFEKISIHEFRDFLSSIHDEINDYSKLKNQNIKLFSSDKNETLDLNINKEFFKIAYKEILYNAFKFSNPNTDIYILKESSKNKIYLSVLSSPISDANGFTGIKEEYSRLIFEPFYRISKLVYEEYPTLDFGLGLTIVDKVIRRHSGSTSVSNVKSYINSEYLNLISFQVELPITMGNKYNYII